MTILFNSILNLNEVKAKEYLLQPIDLVSNVGIYTSINTPDAPHTKKVVILYNNLIKAFKSNIFAIATRIQDYMLNLLIVFAIASIVFIVSKSFISGEPLTQALVYKLSLFLLLSMLLHIEYFKEYILKYLITLFDNIPSLFSDSYGNNIVENIINQTSNLITNIHRKVDEIGWGWNILAYISAFIAIVGIFCMMLVILINILEISFYFYTTLCLSSIFILLFFFKSTRNYSMGAINIIVTSLLNIIILSLFLSIIGEMISTLLIYENSVDFVTNCMMIVLITVASTLLLLRIKIIAQAITSQGLATISPAITQVYKKFNNK